jgi:hypothetical protein
MRKLFSTGFGKTDFDRPLCASAPLRGNLFALVVAIVAIAASCQCVLGEEPGIGPTTPNPQKIVGSDQCAKCHQQEVQQWMQTPHFATFDSLHRTPRAKEIAERLGERSIKRSPMCTQCHYTEQNQGGRMRVVAGVSCESCHGGTVD